MSQIEQFISKILSQYRAPKDQKESCFSRLQYVMSQLNKKGIKCNYDPPSSPDSRVLLYSSRFNAENYELARECNGLIMDYSGKNSWVVVCRPPDLVNAQYDLKKVEENFECYDVYPARDGTVINLYWYNGRWCISTARGIDMGAMNWCGINYQKNFDALCSRYGVNVDSFDQGTTYTFGFSHPNIHIYGGKNEMWFITAYNNGKRVWTMPESKDVKESKNKDAKTEILPTQTAVNTTMVDMLNDLRNDNKDQPAYGFILRSRDPKKTNVHSTIFIESVLMKQIRTHIYDRNLTAEAPDNVDRLKYAVLRAWLIESEDFLKVFPKFANEHKKFNIELEKLIAEIKTQSGNTSLYTYFIVELTKYRTVSDLSEDEIQRFVRSKDYAAPWYRYLYPEAS